VAEPRVTALLQDAGAGKARKSSSRHKEKKIRDSYDSRISGKKYVCKRNIGMNIKSASAYCIPGAREYSWQKGKNQCNEASTR